MPKMVLLASYLALSATDWSSRLSKIGLTAEIEEKDMTTFASLGWKEVQGGLASGQLETNWKNDTVDSGVDDVMWAHFLTRTPISFEVRLDNASVGSNNPKYTGLVLVSKWTPLSGSVGDVAEAGLTWPTSGAITRAES